MKYLNSKRLSTGLAPPILALMVSLFGIGIAHAITPANTPITNTATVDYEDAATNPFQAVSDTATVVVGAVYSATIEDDELTVSGAPGNQTSIPFTLNNNANAADTFTFTIGNDNGAGTPEGDTANVGLGADIDATTFALYHDLDQSGTFTTGDVLIASTGTSLTGTINNLSAETTAALVLVVDIPATAANNDQIGLIITATSANTLVEDLTVNGASADGFGGFDGLNGIDGDTTVQSLITITANALLDISKSMDPEPENDRISYTLEVTNNGATDATDVRIVDMIPTGTTFQEIEQVNMSVPEGDRFWDSTAGAYRRMTTGQDAAVAPFPIGGTIFRYDDDNSGAVDVTDAAITAQTIAEGAGLDLNDDGATGTNFTGIEFLRATLEPGETVSIVYSVTYDPAALGSGFDIDNTFCVLAGDLDNNLGTTEVETCSNTVQFDVPTTFGVSVDDTAGDGTPDTASSTDDEDATDNDVQHEDSAVMGETIQFRNVITNNGNATDSFNLAIDTGATNTFPVGTSFTFALGGSPIGSNTGAITAGQSVNITVEAKLPTIVTDGMNTVGGSETVSYDEVQNLFYIETGTPSCGLAGGIGGANDPNSDGCFDSADGVDDTFDQGGVGSDDEVFFATLTATSVNDTAATKASDTKSESLGSIKEGIVDLSNSTVLSGANGIDPNINDDAPDTDITADGIIDDGDDTADKALNQVAAGNDAGDGPAGTNDIITTTAAAPGGTVIFPLYVANEQGANAVFNISVDTSITTIPASWNVSFRPLGGGSSISATPSALASGAEYAFEAVIVIPTDGALAPAGDYDFAFRIQSSSNSNIFDLKVDRITVTAVCAIDTGVAGADQVQQLGTVNYAHTVSNNGNETQVVTLSSVISSITGLTAGWTSTTRVDTDTNGTVDTDYATLVSSGGNVTIFDDSLGALANIVVPVGGAITLDPGDSIDIEIRVFAPSSANINDEIRVTTTVSGGCIAAQIIDDTTVALQVRIEKTVAVDPNCTCESEGTGVTAFLQDQTGVNTVAPGQCLIWRLTVTNEGTQTAKKVVISDQVTPFSVAMSAADFTATNPSGNTTAPAATTWYQACQDQNALASGLCTDAVNITDASDATGTGLVDVSLPNVTFNVGTGSDDTTGGDLSGSNVAVGQFCVQVL